MHTNAFITFSSVGCNIQIYIPFINLSQILLSLTQRQQTDLICRALLNVCMQDIFVSSIQVKDKKIYILY